MTVGEVAGSPMGETATRRKGLLRWGPLRRFLLSPLYPTAFQIIGVAFLGLLLYFAFFGTLRAAQNFSTAVTWVLWWGLLPWSFLLLGRAWCGVCPVGALGEWAQKLGSWRRMPGPFLRKYGVWLMALTFLLLTWADRVWNVTGAPRATGVLLALMLAGSLALGLIYQRRAWCRYLCPIGAFSGLYAMTSSLALGARTEACRGCAGKECYSGTPEVAGCPLYQFPASMDSNRNCSLCANCLKSCPRGATDLYLTAPGRQLWALGHPLAGEAFLAVLLVAVVYLQTINMTTAFPAYMKWLVEATPVATYEQGITLTFAAFMAPVLALYGLASHLAGRVGGEGFGFGFSRFAYAYIPLALAGHLAHNLFHLLSEGAMALRTALEQLGWKLAPAAEMSMDNGFMTVTSVIMVLLGLGGGLYILARAGEAHSRRGWKAAAPHMVLLLALGAIYLQMFLLPMNPRHAH